MLITRKEVADTQSQSGARRWPADEDTDHQAKLETFQRHRGLLASIAYRMLGSVADAEDMLQDTFIRWQASSDAVESPRAFLITILSRLCINHLQSARVQREEYFGQWLPEPLPTPLGGPFEDIQVDDSLSIAFLAVLERLNPVERAVFLLREIFEYGYGEIGTILGETEVNCRQILRRAKQRIEEGRLRFAASQQDRLTLLQRFRNASSQGDMEGLIALLSHDAALYADGGGKARAVPNPIFGSGNIARFIKNAPKKLLPANLVQRLAEINGQPGIISYADGDPFSVFTLDVRDGQIQNIYIISNPEKLRYIPKLPLGLP